MAQLTATPCASQSCVTSLQSLPSVFYGMFVTPQVSANDLFQPLWAAICVSLFSTYEELQNVLQLRNSIKKAAVAKSTANYNDDMITLCCTLYVL